MSRLEEINEMSKILKRVVEVSTLRRENKLSDFWLKDQKWETRKELGNHREGKAGTCTTK